MKMVLYGYLENKYHGGLNMYPEITQALLWVSIISAAIGFYVTIHEVFIKN
jgi:hypothetical protein